MGTNYYIKRLPTAEQKDTLKKAIDQNDSQKILDMVEVLYKQGDEYSNTLHNVVHLGKNSYGWVFLWNPNILFTTGMAGENDREDPKTIITTRAYDLNHKSIHDFIFDPNNILYNEYNEIADKDEFWKKACELEKDKNPALMDNEKYYNKRPSLYSKSYYAKNLERVLGVKVNYGEFYSDGMRFSDNIDFC